MAETRSSIQAVKEIVPIPAERQDIVPSSDDDSIVRLKETASILLAASSQHVAKR